MVTHARRQALTGGTTAETYGTAVTETLDANARRALALLVFGAAPTDTAEEGSHGILRINASSLGLSNQKFMVGPYETSGPATNSSGQGNIMTVIPLDWKLKGNERISYDIAPSATVTAGKLYELALLWRDDVSPPADWLFKFPNTVAVVGGDQDSASQTTTTRTAMAALTIPAWAREVVGYKATVQKTGAITTAEEGLGYFELQSTIPGITPLELPTVYGTGAALGTPAGGSGQYISDVPYVPIHIPTTGKEETITPFIILRTAVTTANTVSFSLIYR